MAGMQEVEVGEGEDCKNSTGEIGRVVTEAHIHSTHELQLLSQRSRDMGGKQERGVS